MVDAEEWSYMIRDVDGLFLQKSFKTYRKIARIRIVKKIPIYSLPGVTYY